MLYRWRKGADESKMKKEKQLNGEISPQKFRPGCLRTMAKGYKKTVPPKAGRSV